MNTDSQHFDCSHTPPNRHKHPFLLRQAFGALVLTLCWMVVIVAAYWLR
jgi:hypothetical protein